MSKIDPITLEVVRNALVAYADEMATVLCKTAYNMMIYEVRDYCVGIVDPDGNIIAQNTGGLPIFLSDLGVAVKDGVDTYGKDGFRPGDVVMMNYPYICGQHLNNIVIYTPFFFDGELIAFPAVRAHWVDIGGSRIGFGSSATTEIYEEGLQIRSIKIFNEGRPDEAMLRLIGDNIRFREAAFGDMRAQIAACRLGERRLTEMFDRYGRDTVHECIKTVWDQSEALTRLEVEKIPDGVYEAESFLDNDGVDLDKTVPIKVKVTVKGSDMVVDFSEVSDQVRGPINCGISGGMAAARVAFKCVTLPSLPVNEGCFYPLQVVLPPGKLLSAQPPAAIGGWSISLPTVIDTILAALAPGIPDKIPAAHKGDMGGYSFHGVDGNTGKRYVCMNIPGGGWGGRPFEDGENGSVSICQGDVKNVPVELQEIYYPLIIDKHVLRQDSGGAGKYRGGLGLEITVRCLYDTFSNIRSERTKCPPWGLLGGKTGAANVAVVKHVAEEQERVVLKRTNYPLKPGDTVTFLTGGGGGFGDSLERDVELVRQDVIRGYVSLDRARQDYGVVIDPETFEVDKVATQALRKRSG